jgi:hypothetical protein
VRTDAGQGICVSGFFFLLANAIQPTPSKPSRSIRARAMICTLSGSDLKELIASTSQHETLSYQAAMPFMGHLEA